jgi:hypothetical protein
MKVWWVFLVVALVAAIVVILLTAFLEAEGRLRLPWPVMARQLRPRFGPFAAAQLVEAGPYVQAISGLLLQFLVGALILYAMPERMRRLTDAAASGWREVVRFLFIGLLLVLGLGAVAVLSAFYVHTAALVFVLGGVLFLGTIIGAEALALALGREGLRRAGWSGGSPLVALFVGTTLLYALTRLPYAAPVVMALLGLTGAGVALSTRFGGRRTWSLEALREVNE